MKIAAIITGHLRGGIQNFHPAYNNFFSRYDSDIYISTWNQQEGGPEITEQHLFPWKETGRLINYKIHDLKEYERTKKWYVEDYERTYNIEDICRLSKHQVFAQFMNESEQEKRGTHCGFGPEAIEYWANRIKDQYYMVRKSFDLLDDYEKYDTIIRFRFDLLFLTPFKFNFFENKLTVATNSSGDLQYPYDCIQYGRPEVMKKYFLLNEHIDNFITNLNYLNKFSYRNFNAENMMKHYMEEYGDKKFELYMDQDMREHVNFILQRG